MHKWIAPKGHRKTVMYTMYLAAVTSLAFYLAHIAKSTALLLEHPVDFGALGMCIGASAAGIAAGVGVAVWGNVQEHRCRNGG
ncbi:hypothetical protein, partial [Herbaspirillum sp.]|uniref:hypothetical protein n=1 Tax=Herbaspirillum sp. TaxID=1890675 RepID=UPI00258D3028